MIRKSRSFIRPVVPGLLVLACILSTAADDAGKRKDKARAHLQEARRLAADYKIEKAAGKAHEALQDDPSLAEAHVYLGLEHFRANDLNQAEAEFQNALDLDPYQAAAHCYLGFVLYQKEQLEPATDHWLLATRLDSSSPHAYAGLALSQFKHGQEDEAVQTFNKALLYDRRFADSKFLESDNGPKWSGRLLQDFQQLLAKVPKPSYP